jgi:6-phosphogluconate dehydrogenase
VNIGMIGLGRMGSNMVRRLELAGHSCVVFDRDPKAGQALVAAGATSAASPEDLLARLPSPRIVWIMIPAAAVDPLLTSLLPTLRSGDIVIDGGNTYYGDDIRRARLLAAQGVRYLDIGTSGGLWGLERGYCLMVGGAADAVAMIEPILAALAVPAGANAASASTATRGYLHVGPSGAGHFVKMVHNGIEYGLMAAFAEGFNLLHTVSQAPATRVVDAETAPSLAGEPHSFDFKLDQIAELWRHGSVVSSWLLDLLAGQLAGNPGLEQFAGHVADSGEGRWTIHSAVEAGVPVPVLATALFARFSSRGEAEFANRALSAMRLGFGGHHENAPAGPG